jgi:hypothetical protein
MNNYFINNHFFNRVFQWSSTYRYITGGHWVYINKKWHSINHAITLKEFLKEYDDIYDIEKIEYYKVINHPVVTVLNFGCMIGLLALIVISLLCMYKVLPDIVHEIYSYGLMIFSLTTIIFTFYYKRTGTVKEKEDI